MQELEILIQQQQIITEGLKIPACRVDIERWEEVLRGIEKQIELIKRAA